MTKKCKELYLLKQGVIGRHGLYTLVHIDNGKLHRVGNWSSPHDEHAKAHAESDRMVKRIGRVMSERGHDDYKIVFVDDPENHKKLKKYIVEKKEFKPDNAPVADEEYVE